MPKKILKWAGVAFVLFYVVTAPQSAAGALKSAGSVVARGLDGIGVFVSAVLT